MSRPDDGSATVDVMVWVGIWALIVPALLTLARAPAIGLRLDNAVAVAAREGALGRSESDAEARATAALVRNLRDSGGSAPCLDPLVSADASSLRPARDAEGLPSPGMARVALDCDIPIRHFAGAPVPGSVTIRVPPRHHVGDVYRRVE